MDSVPSFEKESTTREVSEFTHDKKTSKEREEQKKKEERRKEKSSKKKESSSGVRAHRELNKRLKCIYEDEGKDYGDDTSDEETLASRFKVAEKLRASRIEEVFKAIRRARNVQLSFLVDVTGSMQPHIDGVRTSIDQIIKKLTDDGPHVTFANTERVAQCMEVAFVAYRDHGDTKQFEVLPFANAEKFKIFSSGLHASGGGDGPEDVFGGIDSALNLRWSDNYGTKVIFHICDAPCHGKEYHSGMGDDYPAGDPKGRTAKGLFSRLREEGIQYHFGKITDHTNIMIKKFSEAYGEPITEFNVKNVNDIRDCVITAVSESISTSVMTSHRTGRFARKERDFITDEKEPNWAALKEMEGKFISYEFPKSIKDIEDDIPLERKKPKSAIVKIAPNPFGKGMERIAFYGKDLSTYVVKNGSTPKSSKGEKKKESFEVLKKNEDIVLKENKDIGKGLNSAKRYEISNQMQTIASFLAQKYMEDLKKIGIDKTIKFLKIRTISLMKPDSTLRFMSCERRFGTDVKFIRFTNNTSYRIMEERAMTMGVSMEYVQLVTAFSHWTYKASNGFLMVVDLEGVVANIESDGKMGVLLTDPAIHCKDTTRYGRMNHGVGGMEKFFARHECNQFCKALRLETFVCST